ncbi:MAG: hypothetical protein KA297_29365 [Kofleriaceae bacterium]|nr:hypothetical protein [Kofleriaceae bacterium]
MTGRRWSALAAVLGLGLVAGHAAVLPRVLDAWHRPELTVDLRAPAAAPRLDLPGQVPAALRARVRTDVDGVAIPLGASPSTTPGLHHQRWRVRYRGGFERSVGASQLVGPLQPAETDPTRVACTGRISVGRALLDDGQASPGTIAHVVRTELDHALRGLEQFPIGSFQKVRAVALRWTTPGAVKADRGLVGADAAPDGYLRVHAVLGFTRVDIPVTLAFVPTLQGETLGFTVRARAELDFDSRVLQWVSDLVGGDKFATRITRQQVDQLVVAALEPPPPVDLGGGRQLHLVTCGRGVRIVDDHHAELAVGVRVTALPGAPDVLPPRWGPAELAPPDPAVPVTLDLDLDGLGAILYELWRQGVLDEELAAAGLDRRFNQDPTVRELLTVRTSPMRLALPPTVAPGAGGLRLAVAGVVTLADGATTTPADVWGALDLSLAAGPTSAAHPGGTIDADVRVGALELTCRAPSPAGPDAVRLVPCYADLVGAIRDRAPEAHGALGQALADLLARIFVGQRLEGDDVPAALVVLGVRPSLRLQPRNGAVRLELAARLE